MRRINRDPVNYNKRLYEQACEYFVPDFTTIAGDMGYNNGPMTSGELFDGCMLPYCEEMIPSMKAGGTRVFIDSDGDISMTPGVSPENYRICLKLFREYAEKGAPGK